ncbi:MAG: hypothetical protein WCK77_17925 [Verrucomicrobiota bacterium]
MKFLSLLRLAALCACQCSISQAAALPPEIEDAEALGSNKQPWHATLMPYADVKEAIAANRYASSLARSLNGMWKFHYVARPEERPVDFYKPGYDVSKWGELPVPSCWQVQGFGTPYYRNNGYTLLHRRPQHHSGGLSRGRVPPC